MNSLNPKLLKKFLKLVGDQLQGDWLLIGGTVLPMLEMNSRVTVDVDLIPLSLQNQNTIALELAKLAERLKIPIETINPAGVYFLEKIPHYKEKIVLLHHGKSARIYRPDVNLFIHLKIGRLTETDLSDCLEFIKYAKRNDEKIDHVYLKKIVNHALKNKNLNAMKKQRLQTLLSALHHSLQ